MPWCTLDTSQGSSQGEDFCTFSFETAAHGALGQVL